MSTLYKVISLFILITLTVSIYDITQFGAVPNSDSVSDQFKTQRAILSAIAAANSSTG
jgi:hypothetical protein